MLVATPKSINMQLEVGNVNETVTVTGGEVHLNTSDATIGNTFSQTQIRQLPLEGRNVAGLLSLQPGVTFIGNVSQDGGTTDYRNGTVNGGKSDQANVTLDGVDVNDQQTGQAFNSVLRVTLDSVQEFRVVTTNPNADQGRSSGAQISLVTKSGSNPGTGPRTNIIATRYSPRMTGSIMRPVHSLLLTSPCWQGPRRPEPRECRGPS